MGQGLSYTNSPEEVAPVGVGDGGDGDGDGGEDCDVGRGGGVGVRGVAEEEGAEAHALGDVAVAVRLALLVEHLVLGRAAATRYLAFWNKAGVSDAFSRGKNEVSILLRHPQFVICLIFLWFQYKATGTPNLYIFLVIKSGNDPGPGSVDTYWNVNSSQGPVGRAVASLGL